MKKYKKKIVSESIVINIPFYDFDQCKLIWFGNYFKYLDVARTKLLKKIKYDINEIEKSGMVWPVIETKCKYKKYLRYNDTIEIEASIIDYKYKLKINYTIKNKAKIVAEAHTIQIPVSGKTFKLVNSFPKKFIRAIENFKYENKKQSKIIQKII